jgi:hypothetical protein
LSTDVPAIPMGPRESAGLVAVHRLLEKRAMHDLKTGGRPMMLIESGASSGKPHG